MNIQNYLETTDKLFEEKYPYLRKEEIKSFLHQRQVGLIELVKGCVPEEENKTVIGYRNPTKEVLEEVKELNLKAEGFNSCRSAVLEMLELVDKQAKK